LAIFLPIVGPDVTSEELRTSSTISAMPAGIMMLLLAPSSACPPLLLSFQLSPFKKNKA
jgi:hypothetical protein